MAAYTMISAIISIPELWERMVSYLSPTDLARLTRVSQVLNRAVESHLYKKIVWSWDHSAPENSTPIHQLLFKILRRPDLALHAHEVCVTESGYGPKPRLLNAETPSYEERSLVRASVENSGLPFPDRWIERICILEAEVIIAFIVLQLPNIRKITIDMFHRSDGYDKKEAEKLNAFAEVLRVALMPNSVGATKLKRLTDIHWPSESFDCHADLIRREEVLDVILLLQAPQLRALSLKLSQPRSPLDIASITSRLAASSQSISALTSLSLRYTTISESLVVQLLSRLKRLQSCRLEMHRGVEALTLDAAVIRNALSPCRSVLRELVIDLAGYEDYDVFEKAPWTPLGSLKDFCSIEHIESTSRALIGGELRLSDVLPQSLRSLKIWQGPADFDEGLGGLLGPIFDEFIPVSRAYVPHLKSVMIGLHKAPTDDDPLWQRLQLGSQQSPALQLSFFEL